MKYFLLQCLFVGIMTIAIGSLAEDKPPIIKIEFDEGRGSKAAWGNASKQTGTLEGNYQWVAGRSGKAVKFTPKSSLTIPYATIIYRALKKGIISIDGWIYREKAKDMGFVIRQEGSFSLLVIPWDPRRLNLAIWEAKTKKYLSFNSEPCLKIGKWQHFGIIVDHKQVKIYVDGILVLQNKLEKRMSSSRADIYIGSGFDGLDKVLVGSFAGTLDSLKIYDYVKNDSYFTRQISK